MSTADLLDEVEAQMRFTLSGSLRTGSWDRRGEFEDRAAQVSSARLIWNTSFGGADYVEVGGRFEAAYLQDEQGERLGPELFGIAARFRLVEGDGLRLYLGLGGGKRLRFPGDTLLEAEGVLAYSLTPALELAGEAFLGGAAAESADTLLAGGLAIGPSFRPHPAIALSFEVQGRLGTVRESEHLCCCWDVLTGVRLGLSPSPAHEVGLAAQQGVAGTLVDETSRLIVSYRYRWQTEDGFLRLDYEENSQQDSDLTEADLTGEPDR